MRDRKIIWECEPCGHINDDDSEEICMVCNNPRTNEKLKIVKKKGREPVIKRHK